MKTMCLFMSRAMPMVCCVVMSCLLFCSSVEAQQNRRLDVVALTAFQLSIFPDRDRNGKIEFGTTSTDGADKAIPSDKTTANRPYRFWINNDFDVTNEGGEPVRKIACDEFFTGGDDEQFEQQCEQWDEEATSRNNNTASGQLTRIENIRDLEDFAPLKIKLSPYSPSLFSATMGSPKLALRMRAVGVGINVFQGVWNDSGEEGRAHDYLLREALGKNQADPEKASHVLTLPEGGGWRFLLSNKLQGLIDDGGDNEGEIRLIFEGVSASNGDCATDASGCYIEVEVFSGAPSTVKFEARPALGNAKLYLDLHDVKDFYDHHTAGNADNSGDFDPDEPSDITLERGRKVDLLEGVPSDASVLESDYVLFVHGWRMRKFEKLGFAETAFKRLYWSGYQGRFGMLSWPTGYFDKPAHIYDFGSSLDEFFRLALNTQNYDASEVVARQTGDELADYISTIRGSNAGAALHVVAHSMGNVVVSEMLKNSAAGIINSYAASQAAESAGAYDTEQASMQHLLVDLPATFVQRCEDVLTIGVPVAAEFAWHCYSSLNRLTPFSSQTELIGAYDIPPDRYQYPDRPINWGRTDGLDYSEGAAYYEAASNGFDGLRIVNFYNPIDAALTAWELNHLFKPDSGWRYLNDTMPIIEEWRSLQDEILALFDGGLTADEQTYLDNVLAPREDALSPVIQTIEDGTWHQVAGNQLNERYEEGRFILPDRALTWNFADAFDIDSAQVLGFITPARNEPLGQVSSITVTPTGPDMIPSLMETTRNLDPQYTDSNQDHSGQFYNGFALERLYWRQVILEAADIDPNTLSGLQESN